MAQLSKPSFNLWTERWITVEGVDGRTGNVGIEDALLEAQVIRAIHDPSPLVEVGIHRLLVAILQFVFSPQKNADIRKLWRAGRFPPANLSAFGKKFARRFDLFSMEEPFLQSADIPLQAGKETKSVVYLTPEMPAATAVTHYRHGDARDQVFCPGCATRGLVTIPPFSTSGGAGIKPSINGVPPIYIIPGGNSLFQSLVASLTQPDWQPKIASRRQDTPWWVREPVVRRSMEVGEVGYLHSLTFAARRVRLHPEPGDVSCTRCGSSSGWVVRRMVFEMGESRPKGSENWVDPFAAYRIDRRKGPIPIRPVPGKVAWREFASLFLAGHRPEGKDVLTQRPTVLDQISTLELDDQPATHPFRCVGMRTDMKAKVFEWLDAGFDVPVNMLREDDLAMEVREAIDFATECRNVITGTFREYYGGRARSERSGRAKNERHGGLKDKMEQSYWRELSVPFRNIVLQLGGAAAPGQVRREWATEVVKQASFALTSAAEMVGEDAANLARLAQVEKWGGIRLFIKRKEYLNE